MKNQWSTVKSLISTYEKQQDIFLSVLDNDGMIVNANAYMVKSLQIQPPRLQKTSIYDLIHPVNVSDFRTALKISSDANKQASMEIFIRNGQYHPVKWQINPLTNGSGTDAYLCVGHKIVDDARLEKFNKLSEQNYHLIMEGLGAGILFQDRRGELIAANQKAADLFGTTLERLYQLRGVANLWNTMWDIRTEDHRQLLFQDTPFMKALVSGKTETRLVTIKLSTGDQRWYRFTCHPLFESNNTNPYAVVTNFFDVTQEQLLTAELTEKKALFNAFMNQTPNLAWVVDQEATLISGNQAFFQYLNIEEHDSVGHKLTDLVPPSMARALFEKHLRVFDTGRPVEVLEKVKWADGTEITFHINLFLINGSNGNKLLGGHAVNLADKYAAEKKLREVNDRLLLLTRATSDAIWEWDMQTGHIFRNDALMDMVGYHVGDQKGLSWWLRRIHPEDRDRISDAVKESTDNNRQSWEEEYRFKCADGTYKHMRDKGFIVYENGLPVKMIGSAQDVSSIKEMENQLMEEKFRSQKEMSETVIRVQELERTRIGHELHDNVNQILSTIKLFVDMLTPVNKEEKKIKDKSIEYVVMAIEEIRKLSKELVIPKLKDKGLVESIAVLVDDMHFSTDLKIRFTHDLELDLLTPGVQVTLFRIVQEQLKNIIKHSRASKVDITLQRREDKVHLLIRDNGVGFDSAKTHRGIGLSNIIDRTRFYNGTPEINSAPGKGCVLSVEIPLPQ